MQSLLTATGLIVALIGLIGVLIIVPSLWLGIAGDWKIIFLSLSYFCFFLGTIWRVLRYGQLVSRNEDEQVKKTSGRLASLIGIIGILGVHWLSLYDFALKSETNHIISGDRTFSIVAIALSLTAIIVNQIAIRTLGKFFDRLAIKSDHQLVKNGIYNIIRHPIYTSYILLFIGFCTMLQSLLGLGILTAICIVWFGSRMRIEEQMLTAKFGDEYRDYCQHTKRLFPYIY
ncbi:MAG: isoprenylcysteine carboxylmethyltransferase family protein [Nostocaceae cyanobacterium]|nr:isoprenylcysteine carboxylmethyltransferase family protein [Nostocaceae cyanobacterium]